MIFFSVNGKRFSFDINRILILSTKMKFEDPLVRLLTFYDFSQLWVKNVLLLLLNYKERLLSTL